MLRRKKVVEVINNLCETGASYSEVFEEETKEKNYHYVSEKLDGIGVNYYKGIGIRLGKGKEKSYGYTNNYKDIDVIVSKLKKIFNDKRCLNDINIKPLKRYNKDVFVLDNDEEIKKAFYDINNEARGISDKVSQVEVFLRKVTSKIRVANSKGSYVEEIRLRNHINIKIFASFDGKLESSYFALGSTNTNEFFDMEVIREKLRITTESAIAKLTAEECPGGKMPVVIGNGFGGVIFHEACGHSLEATSTSKGLSPFSNIIGDKISNNCVTLVDNAVNDNMYGSEITDDEGNIAKKNVLIEKGILKSFLVDNLNAEVMNMKSTSSGRRQSYKYAPTSRMHNTYLEKGTDKIEDMISSIKHGLYAASLGGGSVNTTTGEFNFNVTDAFMIRDGKIAERVKGASLIGTGQDVLKEISMVSDDLVLTPGTCGSISGSVPVTVGQPTIKVDNILVGGSYV